MTLLLSAADVRAPVTPADALEAVRGAFVRLAGGEATVPRIMDFELPGGEAHVKGAWLHGDEFWSVKAATGFYGNPALGLPSANGVSLVISAVDGQPAAVVLDGGLLTELRTAAAGALTVTPSETPLIRAGWLRPGAHLTAVGSDMPGKHEVEAAVLGAADLVVADHPPVAAVNGELQWALAGGAVGLEDVVALGSLPRRRGDADVTVCDLVGIGVQDAAIAGLVAARAIEREIGSELAR